VVPPSCSYFFEIRRPILHKHWHCLLTMYSILISHMVTNKYTTCKTKAYLLLSFNTFRPQLHIHRHSFCILKDGIQ